MSFKRVTTASNSARRSRVLSLLAVATLVIGCSVSGVAQAEWQLDPLLRVAWDFDDNATLSVRTDQEQEISGYIGEASINFAYDSERAFFSMRPMARTRDYGSNSDRSSDDQFLRLNMGYSGQKNSLRFLADYGRESVRTAEIADAELDTDIDPDEITDDETAIVGIKARRERIRVMPRWTYQFSDVAALEADVSFLTVDYETNLLVTRLFDYTDIRYRLSYRRRFSTTNTGILTVTARDYETTRFGADRTGLGIAAGFNRSLSQTTEIRALFGIEDTEQEDIGQGTIKSDPNFVTDISIVRNLETIRLLAQYRQRINASGSGELTTRDEINLRMTRDLNDKISAGLGVRAYTVNSVDGNRTDQDYVQLRGQLLWRITPAFSMQADYRYTVLNRQVLQEGANSNRITVWFSYRPSANNRDTRLRMR